MEMQTNLLRAEVHEELCRMNLNLNCHRLDNIETRTVPSSRDTLGSHLFLETQFSLQSRIRTVRNN